MKDERCVGFLQWALPRLGMRWEGFRKPRDQVCKRVARRMAELGITSCEGYRARLEAEPGEWAVLDSLCRVTISRFYRDRGVFDHLRGTALPALARSLEPGGTLRAWSAGCASGEEPYTLSLIWALDLGEGSPGVGLRVVATDAEPDVLARARRACYPRGTLDELPDRWVEEAFDRADDEDADDPFCLRDRYTRPVELRREDIRDFMPAGPFHLVLCRNLVFTYFRMELQRRLLRGILERIPPDGALILGAHEELPDGEWPLERWGDAEPVYRRTEEPAWEGAAP